MRRRRPFTAERVVGGEGMTAPLTVDKPLRRAAGSAGGTRGVRALAPWKRQVLKRVAPYLFISPAYALFLVFICLPLAGTIIISFTSWPLLGQASYDGLGNYHTLLHDGVLLDALRNTFIFTI